MNSADVPSAPDSHESHGLARPNPAMIHHDLSQIEGCPKRGVKVTVYGLSPWNSLLTFGADAGHRLQVLKHLANLHQQSPILTKRHQAFISAWWRFASIIYADRSSTVRTIEDSLGGLYWRGAARQTVIVFAESLSTGRHNHRPACMCRHHAYPTGCRLQ
jgi:hypothetical protein